MSTTISTEIQTQTLPAERQKGSVNLSTYSSSRKAANLTGDAVYLSGAKAMADDGLDAYGCFGEVTRKFGAYAESRRRIGALT